MLPMFIANIKMMVRDRQTIFWAVAFPVIFVVVFGLFDLGGGGSAEIVIIDQANTPLSRDIIQKLEDIEFLDASEPYDSLEEAQKALNDGALEYVLVIPQALSTLSGGVLPGSAVSLDLYYDQSNIQINQMVIGVIRQFLDQVNLQLARAPQLVSLSPEAIQARQVDYFDVLLMGLIGMGVMVNSIISIAVKISTYRNQNILKRILVTPLPIRNYFASEVLAHLLLAMVQVAIIIAVGVRLFGARIYGNVLWIFLIAAFANIIFLNIGFILSAWAKSPAAASSMGNAIALPMMFFSGTFFPTSNLPAFLPELVRVLPLTPMLEALRHVSIDGWAIWQTWPELAILAGWVVVSSAAAMRLFRFR